MKRLRKLAESEGSNYFEENGEVKHQVVDFMIDNMKYEGSANITPAFEGDETSPPTPAELEVQLDGVMQFVELTDKFGELGEGELAEVLKQANDPDSFVHDAANQLAEIASKFIKDSEASTDFRNHGAEKSTYSFYLDGEILKVELRHG